MDLRQLRAFVAVAEELNFTRAAERLHRAQSPLSRQIAGLEEELGVVLFSRSKRHVNLTPAGEALLVEAQSLLDHTARSLKAVQDAAGLHQMTLTVGFMDGTAYSVMPLALRRMAEHCPEVKVTLAEQTPEALLTGLRQGTVDAGFLLAPFDEAGIETQTLFADPLVLVLPETYSQARHRAVRLAELAGCPLIVHPREHAPELYDWIVGLCERAGFTPVIGRHTTEVHVKHSLVSAGLGWAFALQTFQTSPRQGLVFRPIDGETVEVRTALAWRGTPAAGSALEGLVTCARQAAAEVTGALAGPRPQVEG